MDQLINLDFAPGVRDTDINTNFQLIHDWLTRERLRTGGWGIVEGFELSANTTDFSITVSPGIFVNKDGEEVSVEEKRFNVGAPHFDTVTEELTVGDDGTIILSQLPYSSSMAGYINYDTSSRTGKPPTSEFLVTDSLSLQEIPYIRVTGRTVFVSRIDWAGNKVKVRYLTASNRVDSILLNTDGTYSYEKGIDSTNPSHVELGDYEKSFCIGVVYWTIDDGTNVTFYTDHRSYRMVYTNSKNELYLDGKRYKEAKFINFEQPAEPEEDDVWYDAKNNSLMIWREKDGEYGWVMMNNHSEVMVREKKMWTPDTCPDDLQTFLFADDEVNLYFIPKSNALSITIDNAPLMQDQFEEITVDQPKEYLSTGRGFKLKDPLPEGKYVELIVNHIVQQHPVRETFQRSAVFSSETFEYMADANEKQIFSTKAPYTLGEDQLEVFVDGKRLNRSTEFQELTKDNQVPQSSDKDSMTTKFQVLTKLDKNQVVTSKVSKNIWSYDQLDILLKETEAAAKDAVAQCSQLRADLTDTNGNIVKRFQEVQESVNNITNRLEKTNEFLKKTDKLEKDNMPDDIISKLVGSQFATSVNADSLVSVEGCSINDFIQVHYISTNMNRILMKDREYTLQEDDNGIQIILSPSLVSVAATLYVTGFKIGG